MAFTPDTHQGLFYTHTSDSQSGQAVCLQLNSPSCTGLHDRASMRYWGFIHRSTCEVLHLILCNSFLNPLQCDALLSGYAYIMYWMHRNFFLQILQSRKDQCSENLDSGPLHAPMNAILEVPVGCGEGDGRYFKRHQYYR